MGGLPSKKHKRPDCLCCTIVEHHLLCCDVHNINREKSTEKRVLEAMNESLEGEWGYRFGCECMYICKGGGAERGNGSIESIELRDLKH